MQADGTYQRIATSLDLGEPGQKPKSVTSIPHPWARALLFQTALHNQNYPLRNQLISQWQGMLATIALSEMRQFDLKVQLLKLEELKQRDEFARALSERLPTPSRVLYTLKDQPLKTLNPWSELYIFLWRGKPVGITSPSTLICPSEEGDWTGLPWYRNGVLGSPIDELNTTERALLWLWLEQISLGLSPYRSMGSNREEKEKIEDAHSTISRLLEDFRRSLGTRPGQQQFQLSDDSHRFEQEINSGALRLLNRPIKAESKDSSVRLVPSPQKGAIAAPLIIDPDLATKWNELPQNIWIYDSTTLASPNLLTGLRNRYPQRTDRVEWLLAEELLLPEFYFIEGKENALPGCLLPEGHDRLLYKEQSLTPLLPINPILLKYFMPEDLRKMVKLAMNPDNSAEVQVTIDLPLSGFPGASPKNYRYTRKYELKQSHALRDVPVLEVWPNFRAENWKEYYTFFYDLDYGEDTFQVEFPESIEPHRFKDGRGTYQVNHLDQFPTFVECRRGDAECTLLGLLLIKTPPLVGEVDAGDWKVGVDFGTSFTNVFYNQNDTIERMVLQSLHLRLTQSQNETRNRVLLEFFTTDKEDLLRLPLSSVLTTRISRQRTNERTRELRPHMDGCIYIPADRDTLKPQENYIKTGLKWSTEREDKFFTKLFLEHLALQITAQALKNDIHTIEWFISYPSAFSVADRNTFSDIWKDITTDLQQRTGINHICPDPDDVSHWRPESVAIAQYFADKDDRNLVYSTCIDIGGGTSDISIWENNKMLHQCSIQLAGYHLLTQFLELNPKLLQTAFKVNLADWTKLRGAKFSAKLDVLLRRESETWLQRDRDTAGNKEEFQGLFQLIALGFAGLYYYVGILLRVLKKHGIYQEGKITPVYLGGNGAKSLSWLSEGGRFNHTRAINGLFSQMLTKGSGFQDSRAKVSSYLSSSLKDEVACGLVLSESRLTGWEDANTFGVTDEDNPFKNKLIAGEFCIINNDLIEPEHPLPSATDFQIEKFEIPESFDMLRQFLRDFNGALKELGNPAGVKPIVVDDGIFEDVRRELRASLLKETGQSQDIRLEPPFILSLKALLTVLGKRWAGR